MIPLFYYMCVYSTMMTFTHKNKLSSKKKSYVWWDLKWSLAWRSSRSTSMSSRRDKSGNIGDVTFYVLIHVFSRHFLFYFEIFTSFSFQVPCPSSRVKCLIVFPDSKVFPPVPHCSSCVQIVCVSLVLCQCVVTSHVLHSSALNHRIHSLVSWSL